MNIYESSGNSLKLDNKNKTFRGKTFFLRYTTLQGITALYNDKEFALMPKFKKKGNNMQKPSYTRYLHRSVGGGSSESRAQRSEPFRRRNRGNGLEAALRSSRTP